MEVYSWVYFLIPATPAQGEAGSNWRTSGWPSPSAWPGRASAPERMLFAQTENGGFTALANFGGKQWLIVSPGLGTDEDFRLETQCAL